jgi:uncharacterized membrane protein
MNQDNQTMDARTHRLFRLLIIAVAVALAGSLWAMLRGDSCSSCDRSAELVGGLNLGAIGAAYYGLLLIVSLICLVRPKRLAVKGSAWGMLAAGSVHLLLLSLLVRNRIFCPSCLVTAAGALFGAGLVLLLDRRNIRPAVLMVPVVVIAAYGGIRVARQNAPKNYVRQAIRAERALQKELPLPPPGQARLVVYEWPTCHYCKQFKKEVLTPLRQEFRSRLWVEERTAWKGMGTPTSIVLGVKNARLVGYHSLDQVRSAVLLACGAGEERG